MDRQGELERRVSELAILGLEEIYQCDTYIKEKASLLNCSSSITKDGTGLGQGHRDRKVHEGLVLCGLCVER